MKIKTLTNAQMRIITEKAKPEPKLFLNKYFTRTHLSKTDKIHIEELPDGGRRLAPRVHPRLPGRPVGTSGSDVKSFSPTYLKLNTPIDPGGIDTTTDIDPYSVLYEEDMMVRHANSRANITKEHVSRIDRTWEYMAAMATCNSYVDTEYLGNPAERVFFGRDSALTITLAPSAYWDLGGASLIDPISEFKRAMADVQGGGIAKYMLVGSKVARIIRKSAFNGELKELMDARYGTDGTRLVRGLPDDEPISYLGNISNMLDVYEYTGVFEDVANDGSFQTIKPIEDNEIVITAADIGGIKAFGRIKDLAANYNTIPVFGRNLINEGDPQTESIVHQSAPIMVPAYPNRTLKAKVLAD